MIYVGALRMFWLPVVLIGCAAIVMRVMLANYPFLPKALGAFLIPTVLGVVMYVAATLVARFISPVPRHVYVGRLIFMVLFMMLIVGVYLPWAGNCFSGPPERYYERGLDAWDAGSKYGFHTIWIWWVLALRKRPRRIPDEQIA